MTLGGDGTAAFGRPGGESSRKACTRPIDLAHLSRQTLGDREIEREVLDLFVQQAVSVCDQLGAASPVERLRLAHALKGAARGVGAFAIADCVGRIETQPDDSGAVRHLSALIEEARDFIASISR
ncbi:histidine kinase [Mesorhizobium sp. L-8-10]|uniref:Hpt domain-containing protein n=1 Tax=unclassified Mesorhizobium TaxID=325217 RepID=UPI00192619B9|nr:MULTISPECIES: Hpt domain-containing protein [unclassified Mesorhizobium]BCH24678.1 histidine kinase [Mesorhizobium sp. L-8-3]BCH32414.1 histidine kinase [Mesorhizobium sp. L-8-10]